MLAAADQIGAERDQRPRLNWQASTATDRQRMNGLAGRLVDKLRPLVGKERGFDGVGREVDGAVDSYNAVGSLPEELVVESDDL